MSYAIAVSPNLFSIDFRGLMRRVYHSLFVNRQKNEKAGEDNGVGLVLLIESDAGELITNLKHQKFPSPEKAAYVAELDELDENRRKFAHELTGVTANLAWANENRTRVTADDVRAAYQTIEKR